MKHERTIVSIKQIHHRALKDVSEALEQKLYNSKDISEALEYSNNFRIMSISLKKVCAAMMIVEK